jgi:hypothetical protein
MAPILFLAALFLISTIVLLVEATRDLRILLKGGFDEETNPTDVSVELLKGLAKNPTFIRTVAAVRLMIAGILLLGLIYHLF